jgi:GT2 family glycosyltransferase
MKKYSYTIGIPTRRRQTCIQTVLECIGKQTIQPNAVIIVEQEENHGKEYQLIAKKHGLPLTYIYRQIANTPAARNEILRNTQTPIILFLDDDSEPAPLWAATMCARFDDATIGGCVGRSETIDQPIEVSRTDTGRVTWLGTVRDGFSSTVAQDVDTVIGCNAGFSTDVIRKLGGFDEHYTGNAMREETDMSLRVREAGYRIVFEPGAYVFHRRYEHGGARKVDDRIAWYFHFFSNETYFFLKHRNPVLLPIFLLTKWEWILRCMFGFGREVSLRSIVTPIHGIMHGVWKRIHI